MDTKGLENETTLLHERICSALGDPKRILLLYVLNEKPRCVNDLVDCLKSPQSTISRHLAILREKNLVNAERQGMNVIYSISDPRVIESLDILRAILRDQLQEQTQILNNTL
jgi:ArsR family transcriptional regulator